MIAQQTHPVTLLANIWYPVARVDVTEDGYYMATGYGDYSRIPVASPPLPFWKRWWHELFAPRTRVEFNALGIFKNGVQIAHSAHFLLVEPHFSIADSVHCNAGDYLELRVFTSAIRDRVIVDNSTFITYRIDA